MRWCSINLLFDFWKNDCVQLMSDWKLENLPNGKKVSNVQSEQKKRTTSISKWIYQKITDTFDFQAKFLDFVVVVVVAAVTAHRH